MGKQEINKGIDRRSFLRTTAAVGAGLVLSPLVSAAEPSKNPDDINIALIGAGEQGQVLVDACLKIPGVRFKAICDIWAEYNLKKISRRLKAYRHEVNTYLDYREMLTAEKDLNAVLIATPDFCHAEQTVACLNAGLDVYCEKEMSNTLEGARKMVQAAKQTGKLLQIGHQRRSNPRYLHCYNKLLKEANILGRITAINGQWNRSAQPDLGWPEKYAIDQATLEKYGFESMHQFRNWRLFKAFGAGPIADLGSHQIDIYNWFLETQPKTVLAGGGTDYYNKDTHQWYDNIMAIYEYQIPTGTIRAFYQTIYSNSCQGYYESFMGDQATLVISESASRGAVYREPAAPPWDKWVKMGYVLEPAKKEKVPEEKPPTSPDTTGLRRAGTTGAVVDVRETLAPPAYELAVKMDKLYHQPHLENFFDAIRGKAKLTCPAEVGFETAVTVLKVNEAVEAAKKLHYKPEEFKV